MNIDEFRNLMKPVTDFVAARPIDAALAEALNAKFPGDGDTFGTIEQACHAAIVAGWMCTQGKEGRRFGRVIEAGDDTGRLSVDVVDLKNIVGPHHRHPAGEVCMVMPMTKTARFDGNGRGWCVYEPGSDHHPTVTDGEALVLYLLPEGQIEFTGR